MSDTGHWIIRIPNLTPETAFALSNEMERLLDDPGATHHAVASFCAGEDDDWAVEISYLLRPGESSVKTMLSSYQDRDGAIPSAFILPVQNRDWVAETLKNLAPVPAGRFFVHGRHNRNLRPAGSVAIEIEANQAFGTGHHETTSGCLEALDRELRHTRFRNSLDLGCGSALLAIAIAKTTRGNVLATDIDPVALQIARQNTRLNNVANRIDCFVADGLNHPQILKRNRFDLVMANILSGPLIALANPMRDCLVLDGTLILSGILVRQAPRVEAAYRAAGFCFRYRNIKGKWATLVFKKLSRPKSRLKS